MLFLWYQNWYNKLFHFYQIAVVESNLSLLVSDTVSFRFYVVIGKWKENTGPPAREGSTWNVEARLVDNLYLYIPINDDCVFLSRLISSLKIDNPRYDWCTLTLAAICTRTCTRLICQMVKKWVLTAITASATTATIGPSAAPPETGSEMPKSDSSTLRLVLAAQNVMMLVIFLVQVVIPW